MEEIVIFGASGGAVKVAKTLKCLGIDFLYFVDNDSRKWGTTLEGRQVNTPERLRKEKCRILIASDYQAEIEEQLSEMGLLGNIVIKEELILHYAEQHMDEFYFSEHKSFAAEKSRNLILGLEEGLVLGGIESFTFMLAREMKLHFDNVSIYTKRTNDDLPSGLENNICFFDLDYDNYWDSIKELVNAIMQSAPCVIIDNWQNQILVAAAIIKKYFPDLVKCISFIHNDKPALYRKAAFMQEYMDIVAGVSKKINCRLVNDFGVDREKIRYKESPVEYENNLERDYTENRQKPLKIGYAARVTKFQKRADLLVPLMLCLKKQGGNFHFNIAGDGNYFDKLRNEIEENDLAEYITLYGSIPREDMPDFWKAQDVFLSVSDFEGASISMLEAMSYGTVPVVTAVSGTEEFIHDGKNGLVSSTGDIRNMARNLVFLEMHREELSRFGNESRRVVQKKAGKQEYMAYVANLCGVQG